MGKRVNTDMLERLVQHLNEMTENPVDQYTPVDGKFIPNTGNYHLSWGFGGVGVDQMCEGGGVRAIVAGYSPKRETYEKLSAYVDGVFEGRK